MTVSDPPYNVNYKQTRGSKTLRSSTTILERSSNSSCTRRVCHPFGHKRCDLPVHVLVGAAHVVQSFTEAAATGRRLDLAKDRFTIGRSDYREPTSPFSWVKEGATHSGVELAMKVMYGLSRNRKQIGCTRP